MQVPQFLKFYHDFTKFFLIKREGLVKKGERLFLKSGYHFFSHYPFLLSSFSVHVVCVCLWLLHTISVSILCASQEERLSLLESNQQMSLREKCPYSELFWSVSQYFILVRISPYSVRMRENTDQNYSEYGYFSRSVCGFCNIVIFEKTAFFKI